MKKAVILAGGLGERLRPLTEDRPKAMVNVLSRPIMAYQLHWLRYHGITEVVVSCGHRHEVIRDYFEDGSKWQVKIDYVVEKEPRGRGGGLKLALNHWEDLNEPVLALNGDTFTNLDISALAKFHETHCPLATLVTVPLKTDYGIVDIDASETVTGFREKPELPYDVNAGIYALDPKIIDLLPDKGDHETETFPQLARKGQLKAFRHPGYWRAVDTAKDLTVLRMEMEQILLDSVFQPVAESSRQ